MTPTAIKDWASQPSTILGLGTAAGTICGLVAHALTGSASDAAAAGGAAFAIVHVILPDNTAAPSSVEKLVTDSITAIAQRRLAAAMPLLVQDAIATFAAVEAPPLTTTTTTTVAAPAAAVSVTTVG